MNNETVIEFGTATLLAQSVERSTAVREVTGLNPGTASIFALLK